MVFAGLFGLLLAGVLAGALVPLDSTSENDAPDRPIDDETDPDFDLPDAWGTVDGESGLIAEEDEASAELSFWDHLSEDPWRDPMWSDPSIIPHSDAPESSDAGDPWADKGEDTSLWDHLSDDPWRDPNWADPSIITYSDGPESADAPPDEMAENGEASPPEWVGGPGETLVGAADGGILSGGAGDDVLIAGGGNSHLQGGLGDDTLTGGAGVDTLDGGGGNDVLVASGGPTLLRGAEGDDLLTGGAGDDTLQGGGGADTLVAGNGVALLDGGFGDDVLSAGKGIGTLFGGGGDDTLTGAQPGGIALMNGGAGDDVLVAGQFDILHGGTGADTFVLGDWVGMGGAFVQDFDQAEDRLVIVYDPATHPDPVITLASVAGQEATVMVLLDGTPLAVVQGAAGILPDDIDLVVESPVLA
jgi:hypothetical protein